MKLKRILALLGAVILAALYLSTLVFALMDNELADSLLIASVLSTIFIPIILYAFQLITKALQGHHKDPGDN